MKNRERRRRGHSVRFLAGGGFLMALAIFLLPLPQQREGRVHGNGLFSWQSAVLRQEAWPELFQRMEALGLGELYQHIPRDTEWDAVSAFTAAAQERGISVYLLTGHADWSLDPSGKAMTKEITRAKTYPGLRGVIMDVEPYGTDAWDDDPDQVMTTYVEGMTRARTAADRAGLELIACIPYFFDNKGQTQALERLTDQGCHALAVMNYYKGKEAAHIETECALAKKYDKPILTIYELQPPGTHDLTDRNTYHQDGLEALTENWRALQKTYPSLSFALHNYEALKEVLDN